MTNYLNDCKNLLHPVLMSNEQLIEILTLRCIKLSNKETLSRGELLELYNRIALPLEQRNARHSTTTVNEKTDESTVKLSNSNPTCVIPSRKVKLNRSVLNNDYESQRKITKLMIEGAKMDNTKNGRNELKRIASDCDEKQEPVVKKARQKITWP